MSVRVRYAPSPTGSPHVGNVRTALFDYLLARRFGGQFIVRIEDTDRTRFIPGCEEEILESLQYVGLTWDEAPNVGGPHTPYRQSERKEAGLYQPIINTLLESGAAYYAFETAEELAEMREFQQINKQPTGYFGGTWRDATPAQVEAAHAAGKPGVIRLRMPRDERIVVNDAVRGRVEVDSNTQDDAVLIKADGMPTYHFAAIVDDHLMSITHVIRGEEWISSAPKHIQLIKALGWSEPIWVHVPVINGRDGKKLSKRNGDTRCLDYRELGYFGHALANFIALIGWSPGDDREIMTLDEMAEAFDISGLQPSPGVFDSDKLEWMNGMYLRRMSIPDLSRATVSFASSPTTHPYWVARSENPELDDTKRAEAAQTAATLPLLLEAEPTLRDAALTLEQERVNTLAGFGPACAFFFLEEPPFDPKAVEKAFGEPHVRPLLDALDQWLESLPGNPTKDEIEAKLRALQEELGLAKLGPVVQVTRITMTGKTSGPGLFDLMEVLGRDVMRKRIARAHTLIP